MNNYLILDFENARLFRKFNKDLINHKTSDFIYDPHLNNGKIKRHEIPAFIEPITVYQISNVLHVLFNERPVPSLRKVFYEKKEYYFQKALDSFLKITTPKINNGDYCYETIQVKKAAWNSWNPSPPLYWEIVKKYVDDEIKFTKLISKLNDVLLINDVEKIPFTTIQTMIKKLDKNKRIDLENFIVSLGSISGLKLAFGEYKNGDFSPPKNSAITNKFTKTDRMVNTATERVYVLAGQIIVPINDNDINILKTSSKGFARILDGGLVTINAIKHENYISLDGFTAVRDISIAKTKPRISKKEE